MFLFVQVNTAIKYLTMQASMAVNYCYLKKDSLPKNRFMLLISAMFFNKV